MTRSEGPSARKRAPRLRATVLGLGLVGVLLSGGCRRPPITPTPTATSRATAPAAPNPKPSATRTSVSPSATVSPTPSPTLWAAEMGTATPAPTSVSDAARPVSTAVPPGSTEPVIDYFRADAVTVDPGDTVTLSWQSEGAAHAILYKLMVSGQLPYDGLDVPLNGSTAYQIPPSERNWVDFLLYVWDGEDHSASAGVTVLLRCPDPWFFAPDPEDICPTPVLVSAAAEQHFERGTMVWVDAEDAIYVLFADVDYTTGWTRFEDRWDEGMPDRDPDLEPPAGLQQPIRGFGLAWREQPGVRDRLGWAVDGEAGFTTALQRTTRYKYNAWYLLALDGDIWYLGPERSSWDKLTPERLTIDIGE